MKPFACCLFFSVFFCAATNASQTLTLVDIYDLAKQNDPIYLQAVAGFNAQQEIKPQARAALLPNVSFQATQADIDRQRSGDSDATSYNLSLQQNVFDGRAFRGIKQANTLLAKADIDLQAAEQSLILRTTQAYFDTLTALDNLRFVQAKKNTVSEQLAQTQQRFDVGLVTNTALKEAEANFDLTIADEIAAENALNNQTQALTVLTGTAIDSIAWLNNDFPLTQSKTKSLEEWLTQAATENLNVKTALLDLETSQHALSIEKADRLPKLNVSLARNYNEDSLLSPDGEYDTTLALSLSVPLYTGGSTPAKIRQAQFQYDASYQTLILQRRQAELETRQAYRNIQAALGRSNAFAKAIESTTAALEATEAGFEFGTRTPTDVLVAIDNVFNAENNFAKARYSFILSYFQLLAAAGNLTIDDIIAINQWLK